MAYKGYFLDNTTYGTDDFNNAFARLTTAGVSLFNEDMLISGTNSATASLVSAGTDIYNEDSCKVTVQDGAYRVLSGTCWLADGTFCVIDDDGVIIAPAEGAVNYVYIEHNTVNNTIDVVVSQTQGGEGSVPLAKINADGTVEDRRVFASAKVGLTSANQYKQADNISVKYYTSYSIAVANCTEINAGFAGFKYVYIDADSGDGHTELIDVSDCKEHLFGTRANGKAQYIKKQGSKLLVYGERSNGERTYEKSFLIL